MRPSERPRTDRRRDSAWKSFPGCNRGTAAIEFAFIAPILLTLIFGVVEFGRYLWVRVTIEQGVESAARYGVLQYKEAQEKIISDWVTPTKAYAAQELFGVENLTVTVTPNIVTMSGIGMVEVQAQYTFTPLIPGL